MTFPKTSSFIIAEVAATKAMKLWHWLVLLSALLVAGYLGYLSEGSYKIMNGARGIPDTIWNAPLYWMFG